MKYNLPCLSILGLLKISVAERVLYFSAPASGKVFEIFFFYPAKQPSTSNFVQSELSNIAKKNKEYSHFCLSFAKFKVFIFIFV